MYKRGLQIWATLLIVTLIASGCESSPQAAIAFRRFASVGRNADDFSRIFKERRATPSRVQEFVNARSTAESKGFTLLTRVSNSQTVAQAFLDEYNQSTTGQIFTLVGHNEGGKFRFYDGSEINLNSVGQNEAGGILAVISCESGRYVEGRAVGVPTDVTYNIAFSTEEKLRRRLDNAAAAGIVIDPSRAKEELLAALDETARERQVRVLYYSIGSGGVVGVAIYLPSRG